MPTQPPLHVCHLQRSALEDPAPFRGFFRELMQVIPPFTLFGALKRGPRALLLNVVGLAGFAIIAIVLTILVPAKANVIVGFDDGFLAISDQWLFLGVGYYAVFSWAMGLRSRDNTCF